MDSKKILIIEDEQALREALKFKFTHEGFSVTEAVDGKEGLDLAFSVHPDLILLDIVMPVMDGVSLLKGLRKDEWGRNVPVIILTNLSDAETIEESIKNNVHDYLIKADYKLEDVIAKVKEKLHINS